jgi:ankyrin repeat protein
MKRTITTAFPPRNNNTDTPDDDTDNAPAPKRVAPTTRAREATPHPIAPAEPSKATPIQDVGPSSQPILVSRGQATTTQQAPEPTQEKTMQGIDVNLPDQDGRTPLMLAAQNGELSTVQDLLSYGANVNAADNNGWTPLMCAAENGHLMAIQALLSAPGIDIDAKSPDGDAALILAAQNGNDEAVKALINKGANVNAANNNGWTPLMSAAQHGHLTTIQILLSAKGIDIDTKNSDGATALILAAANGKDDIVKELINNGADVNITDNNGRTPQMWALQGGHQTTAQILLNSTRISNNLTTMV